MFGKRRFSEFGLPLRKIRRDYTGMGYFMNRWLTVLKVGTNVTGQLDQSSDKTVDQVGPNRRASTLASVGFQSAALAHSFGKMRVSEFGLPLRKIRRDYTGNGVLVK